MNMHEELFIQPPQIGGFNFDQQLEKVYRSRYETVVGQDKIDLWNKLYEFYHRSGENILCQDLILESLDAYWMEPFKADLYFKLGQTKERTREYAAAADAYLKALEYDTQSGFLRYFMHNNLGFCLLTLKRFEEAERYLRIAVGIDSDTRHNAWKNLGVSLEHQGKIDEAFECYCRAFKIDRIDIRVSKHLLRMIERNKITNVDELFDRYEISPSWRSYFALMAEHYGKPDKGEQSTF